MLEGRTVASDLIVLHPKSFDMSSLTPWLRQTCLIQGNLLQGLHLLDRYLFFFPFPFAKDDLKHGWTLVQIQLGLMFHHGYERYQFQSLFELQSNPGLQSLHHSICIYQLHRDILHHLSLACKYNAVQHTQSKPKGWLGILIKLSKSFYIQKL